MTIDRQARMDKVKAKIAAVKAQVLTRYGQNMSDLQVSFNLRGKTAGWAKGSREVRLNVDMIYSPDVKVFDDMIADTIPHEIAHIVCHRNPSLGRRHDLGWKQVCRTLGGTGARCHAISDQPLAKGLSYVYTSTGGKRVSLSKKKHLRVQTFGGTLQYRAKTGIGTVDKWCDYVVQNGHTVVKTVKAEARPAGTPVVGPRRTPIRITGTRDSLLNQLFGYTMPPGTTVVAVVDRPVVRGPVTAKSIVGSKAEQVRSYIRHAKLNGFSQDSVIQRAQDQLSMSKGQAYRYVTENWPKV